jgi:hypothetical protein
MERQPRLIFRRSSTNQSMAGESEVLKLCRGSHPLCPWKPNSKREIEDMHSCIEKFTANVHACMQAK